MLICLCVGVYFLVETLLPLFYQGKNHYFIHKLKSSTIQHDIHSPNDTNDPICYIESYMWRIGIPPPPIISIEDNCLVKDGSDPSKLLGSFCNFKSAFFSLFFWVDLFSFS